MDEGDYIKFNPIAYITHAACMYDHCPCITLLHVPQQCSW